MLFHYALRHSRHWHSHLYYFAGKNRINLFFLSGIKVAFSISALTGFCTEIGTRVERRILRNGASQSGDGDSQSRGARARGEPTANEEHERRDAVDGYRGRFQNLQRRSWTCQYGKGTVTETGVRSTSRHRASASGMEDENSIYWYRVCKKQFSSILLKMYTITAINYFTHQSNLITIKFNYMKKLLSFDSTTDISGQGVRRNAI